MILENYISISKKVKKLVISNVVHKNKYILKNNFLKPIFDSDILNPHISCDFQDCACRINSFVWVSRKRKAIWLEIPKSASRSILNTLNLKEPFIPEIISKVINGYSSGVTIYFDTFYTKEIKKYLKFIKLYNLCGLNLFKKKDFQLMKITPDEVLKLYKEFYSFAIIRNPYERMISNYKMFTEKGFRFDKIKLSIGISDPSRITFEDFVIYTLKNSNHHWEKQVNYLPSDIKNLNFLGTMNNLNSDWEKISSEININTQLPYLNSTKNSIKVFDEFYNKKTYDLVSNHFKEDIKLYNNNLK